MTKRIILDKRKIVAKNLSENVKRVRILHGWTQEEFARKIGVSLSTVQRWEQRGGSPTHLAVKELRRIFREAGIKE